MGLKSNNSAVAFSIQSGGRGTYNEPNNSTDLAAGLANLRPNITAVTVADDSYTGGVFRNADAVAGPDGTTYKARHILFQTVPMGGDGGAGVKVQNIVESDAPGRRVHNPTHPSADAEGYVTHANVNPELAVRPGESARIDVGITRWQLSTQP